jgi:predicted nucleic acid-binding protein
VSAYILDASVAAKWFLPASGETLVEDSLRLFDGFAQGRIHLSVPDLFWPELGNILWEAVRVGRMSPESVEETLRSLSELNIPTSPSRPLLPDALSIVAKFQRTVYDAIYVALAVVSGRSLVTADEKLADSLAAHFPVRWLGSLV